MLPPMLDAMIDAQDRLPCNWPLELITTGGQPITKHLLQSIGIVCTALGNVYASTEFSVFSQIIVNDRSDFIDFKCSHPYRGSGIEMKVVDINGQIVPVNTQGELLVKSPAMFKEYFNDPVKTSAAFDEQGWFRTDDMARMNVCGEIFIDGRKSNMIISGGMNVAPEILEQVIKACPGVESAVVVPVSDDVYYQVLCACVIIKKGSVVTEKYLQNYCEEFHNDKPGLFTVLPKFYLFVDSFPQTKSGKISRMDLKELAKQTITHASY